MYEEYSFVFDIDGTICPIKKADENYADLVPFPEIVEKIKICDITFVTINELTGLPFLFVFAKKAGKSPAFAA